MPKISALPPMTTADGDDEAPIVDDSTTQTKKFTLTLLKTWLQSLATWISKSNVDFDSGIWWEELGRTTLASAGDTITLSGFAAKKYLMVILVLKNSGALGGTIRFNNDSGSNYANRFSTNQGATSTSVSQSSITGWLSGADTGFAVLDIINELAMNKSVHFMESGVGGAASAAPFTVDGAAKWANTAAQITRIDLINTAGGDFDIGSEIVVLGHN